MRHILKDPNLKRKDIQKVAIYLGISIFLLVGYILIWSIIYSIYDILLIMFLAFFGLIPSFLTNAMMPLVANFKFIKRFPMDGGRFHRDGQRILGDGKSWNGFIGGTLLGFILSAILSSQVYPIIYQLTIENFADGVTVLEYITKDHIISFVDVQNNPVMFYLGQFCLCLGCPIGDAIGSYYKRRKKVERGDIFLFWDQNDFILCSILIAYAFFPLEWYYVFFLIVVTPLITIFANIFAYYIGKKEVPW